MKRIFLTVTNDLVYDQRMQRICSSLAKNGYAVTLVGRKLRTSPQISPAGYQQRRLRCFFNKGKWFYAEYNIRLFFFLLLRRMDAIVSIDLDTILAGWYVSRIKRVKRVYDAHELFTELKEVITRPSIQKTWMRIERKTVPHYQQGYTVSEGIADEFRRRYSVNYFTIRNVPFLQPLLPSGRDRSLVIYQGAVNEGRGLEYLIPAMKTVNASLMINGDGNFMKQAKELVKMHGLEEKIQFTGMLSPALLREHAARAYIAVAVPEKEGLNQSLALPNKFFDYMHAGLPQVTVNYPEYVKINSQYEVAVLLPDVSPERIAAGLNNLLADDVLYARLKANCLAAREVFNWQTEEKKLLQFYRSLF